MRPTSRARCQGPAPTQAPRRSGSYCLDVVALRGFLRLSLHFGSDVDEAHPALAILDEVLAG